MADKYILLAGRQIPIQCDAPVFTYENGLSFYNLQTASQSSVQNLLAGRPSGRSYSNRRGFRLDIGQLAAISPEELAGVRQHVRQVVIHHDVTFTAEKCFNVLVSRGLSTHFMINHDGTLYQALDIYHMAWATGANNDGCIAIDLNNPVKLEYADKDPANPPRQVFQGKVNGPMKVALGYTEAQYATLIALFRALITPIQFNQTRWVPMTAMASSFFPPMDAEGQVIDRLIRDHVNFVGFMGHWHCEAQKWDPGPGFDWMRVLAGVHGERNSFPVLLENEHNLADLQGESLNTQLNSYYENIESNETGGWYPVGANQSWHSGVHIHVDRDKPVLNMAKGTIVAVRNAKRVDLGDPGFVVVRHEKEPNVEVVEGEEIEPIIWWSVYMHLGRMDRPEMLASVPWVNYLLNGNLEPPPTNDFDLSSLDNTFPREKLPPRAFDGTKPGQFDVAHFWDGDIMLCEIPVESGEQIGFVGEFGANEWQLEPQVHVEVISGQHLFDGDRKGTGRDWILVEGDLDNNSLINIERVVRPILQRSVSFDSDENARRVLKTSEIQQFFVDGSASIERSAFRRMVCVHKSEWSPTTDWTKTAASAVGWPWETQEAFGRWLLTWVPFQWMTPDVSSHCGFPEDHRFFTYHPIAFLDYLNQSYSGGGGTAEGVTDSELEVEVSEAKRQELAILEELKPLDERIAAGETLAPEEMERYNELLNLLDRHYQEGGDSDIGSDDALWEYDGSFDQWEPGEWDPPKKSGDGLGGLDDF